MEPGDSGRWDTVIDTEEGEGGTTGDEVGGADSGCDIRGICVCVCVCVCVRVCVCVHMYAHFSESMCK